MDSEKRKSDLHYYLEALAYGVLNFADKDLLKKEREDERSQSSKQPNR